MIRSTCIVAAFLLIALPDNVHCGIYSEQQMPPNGSPEYNYILGLLEMLRSYNQGIKDKNILAFRQQASSSSQGVMSDWAAIVPNASETTADSLYMAAIKALHNILIASAGYFSAKIKKMIMAAARKILNLRKQDSGHWNVTRFWNEEVNRLAPHLDVNFDGSAPFEADSSHYESGEMHLKRARDARESRPSSPARPD